MRFAHAQRGSESRSAGRSSVTESGREQPWRAAEPASAPGASASSASSVSSLASSASQPQPHSRPASAESQAGRSSASRRTTWAVELRHSASRSSESPRHAPLLSLSTSHLLTPIAEVASADSAPVTVPAAPAAPTRAADAAAVATSSSTHAANGNLDSDVPWIQVPLADFDADFASVHSGGGSGSGDEESDSFQFSSSAGVDDNDIEIDSALSGAWRGKAARSDSASSLRDAPIRVRDVAKPRRRSRRQRLQDRVQDSREEILQSAQSATATSSRQALRSRSFETAASGPSDELSTRRRSLSLSDMRSDDEYLDVNGQQCTQPTSGELPARLAPKRTPLRARFAHLSTFLERRRQAARLKSAERKRDLPERVSAPATLTIDIMKRSSEIVFSDVLGSGGSAKVYRGMLRGVSFAVKVWDMTLLTPTEQRAVELEARVLQMLTPHDNIVQCVGFQRVGDEARLYMEVFSTTLRSVIDERRSVHDGKRVFYRFERAELVDVLLQVARGLHYLHDSATAIVVHGDLKAENVFVQRTAQPRAVFSMLSHSHAVRRADAMQTDDDAETPAERQRSGCESAERTSSSDSLISDESDEDLFSAKRKTRKATVVDDVELVRVRAPRVVQRAAIGDFGETTVLERARRRPSGSSSLHASNGASRGRRFSFVSSKTSSSADLSVGEAGSSQTSTAADSVDAPLVLLDGGHARGSPAFQAPELARASANHLRAVRRGVRVSVLTCALDIWAFGCVILELLSGCVPYELERIDSFALLDHIARGKRPRLPASVRRARELAPLVSIFERCTLAEPNHRPAAWQLVDLLNELV